MRYVLPVLLLLPLLALAQEPPSPQESPAEKQAPQDQAPKPRLDLYGDPLPEGAVGRLGHQRFPEMSGFRCMALHPDGSVLAAAGGEDPAIALIDVSTAKVVGMLRGHLYSVQDIDFSPDGRVLAALDGDKRGPTYLWRWDLDRGEATVVELGGVLLNSIVFSPDGQTIALAGMRGDSAEAAFILLDSATGEEKGRLSGLDTGERGLNLLGGTRQGLDIVFSPDGSTLATGGCDAKIRLWDARTGQELRALEEHLPAPEGERRWDFSDGNIGSLAYSPDGSRIAAVFDAAKKANTSVVHLWDITTGEEIREFYRGRGRSWYQGGDRIAFSPDGSLIASGCGLTLQVWNVESGETVLGLPAPSASDMIFSSGGQRLAFCTPRALRLVEMESGKDVWGDKGHYDRVATLTFSPDGKKLATGSPDQTIRVWDLSTSKTATTITVEAYFGLPITFSPDGQHIACLRTGSWFRVWHVETGRMVIDQHVATLRPDPKNWRERISCYAFSPDGKRVVGGTTLGRVLQWNLRTPEPPAEWEVHDDPIVALSFSTDGQRLDLWGKRGQRFRFHPATGDKELIQEHVDGASHKLATFSASRDRVALADKSGMVHIREVKTGRELSRFSAHPIEPNLLAFSWDGSRLVTGAEHHYQKLLDPRYRVWGPGRGAEFMSVPGPPHPRSSSSRQPDGTRVRQLRHDPTGTVCGVALSPDGRLLAAGGREGDVHLWEVISGDQLHAFSGHKGKVSALTFSKDGDTLATGSADTTVLLWDVRPWTRGGQRERTPTERLDMAEAWEVLARQDATQAWVTIRDLVARGDDAIEFLEERLQPVDDEPPPDIRKLVDDLGHNNFNVREAAAEALRGHGETLEPFLRQILEDEETPPETRSRLRALVRTFDPPFQVYPSEKVRLHRAIQVLEWIGTDSAKQVLDTISRRPPWAFEASEAGHALQRLRRASKGKRE